ncbi:MAG: diphosphate--fructose-6-phosphate 1-phosphotransferase, partial [Clostridia bacterium]|nr:diphosphate--fructose-6-phosphate 1-phosphotransferase [Clostridia bacterium]
EIFKKYNIRFFFYIGGNDSMDTVKKLSTYSEMCGYEMRVVGVPKTIDNDLPKTDHTPGFGSAAKYIATMTQEIIRDCAVYTVPAVTIIEIMGRDAGWLATAAAAGRHVCGFEPDLVYLPERVFDMDKFISDVKAALRKHPNVVVAASEGIRLSDGRYVGEADQSGATDVFGHKYLSGSGKTLEHAVKNAIGCKVRSIELNLCQRCASHIASKTDLAESVLVGKSAVMAASEGASRVMMTIERISDSPYSVQIGKTDIDDAANKEKLVPDSFINTEGNGVTDECIEYLLPLIKGEAQTTYKDGLPQHFIIK